MTKKTVFFMELGAVAAVAFIVLLAQYHDSQLCEYVNEHGHTTYYCGIMILSLFPVLLLIPFSAILYFLRDEVFLAWWNFAKWWIPVIIGVTLFVNSGSSGSGMEGAIQGGFVRLFLGLFYIIFIAVSLVKIVRAYLRTRGRK